MCAVGYYFEKKRALATGISVCGSGVGTFVFAPLGTYLLDVYGWKGANIVFAALCLQCAVFGALMRPLSIQVQVNEEKDEEEDDDDNCVLKLPDGTIHTAFQASVEKNVQLSSDSQSPSQGRLLPTITEQGVKNTGLSESQVILSDPPSQTTKVFFIISRHCPPNCP